MSQEALLYTRARVNREGEDRLYLMGLLGLQRSYSRLCALLHGLFAFVQPDVSYNRDFEREQ